MNFLPARVHVHESSRVATFNPRHRGGILSVLVVLIAVVAVGGLVWGVVAMTRAGDGSIAADTRTAGPVWYDVHKQDMELTIVSSGELETKHKVEIKNQVESNTTIVEVVPEGVFVKKGDVLMRLADDDIRSNIEQEQLSLEQAKSDQVAAQQSLAIDETNADSDLRAAQVKLNLAKLDLAKWENGDDPQMKRTLDLALEKAKRNVTRDKRDLELSEQLFKEKFISLSELEDDQIAVIEAVNALKTAEQNIEVYNKYTRPKQHQDLLSSVTQASEDLDRTQRKAEINISRSKSTLAYRTRTLRIREQRYAKFQQQLKATVITAPQDGMVVYGTTVGSRRRRDDPITQGRQVRFNELLLVLPDTSQMVASVKINENMMPMIHIGQSAAVTSDFQPGKIMEGTVSQIGVMAEDGGWFNPDVREYDVRIDLPPNAGKGLKPTMRCSARIFTGRLTGVLAVPLQAVITQGKSRFVYVPAADGKVRKQPVTIGSNNESMVQIKQGLQEGDRVLLRRPRPGELMGPADAIAPQPDKQQQQQEPQQPKSTTGQNSDSGQVRSPTTQKAEDQSAVAEPASPDGAKKPGRRHPKPAAPKPQA